MRKLTQKNLDELANVMPIISENEQSRIIGAAKYYTSSGVFVGTLGLGDEMRVLRAGETLPVSGNHLDPDKLYGISLLDATDEEKKAVLKNYLPEGINDFKLGNSSLRGVQAGFSADGKFFINRNGFILKNESSIINTFEHEKYHADTGNFTGDYNEEVNAIMRQINHSSYMNTTREYRSFIADYLIEVSTGNISVYEAYKICKVNE